MPLDQLQLNSLALLLQGKKNPHCDHLSGVSKWVNKEDKKTGLARWEADQDCGG